MMFVEHNNNLEKSVRTARAGFTLIEVMIAITIGAMIIAGGAWAMMGYLEKAKRDSTKSSIKNIQTFLMFYQVENGEYPKTLKDLEKAGFLGKNKKTGQPNPLPKDGWNRPIQYRPTEDGYELESYGPDGKKSTKASRITAE